MKEQYWKLNCGNLRKAIALYAKNPSICDLHGTNIDIDHVEPIKAGGKDDPFNFALTHASCNRSKQASDLRVARVLSRFSKIRDTCAQENRGPNLSDIFSEYGGAKYELPIRIENNAVCYSFPEKGDTTIRNSPIFQDDLSGVQYFVGYVGYGLAFR